MTVLNFFKSTNKSFEARCNELREHLEKVVIVWIDLEKEMKNHIKNNHEALVDEKHAIKYFNKLINFGIVIRGLLTLRDAINEFPQLIKAIQTDTKENIDRLSDSTQKELLIKKLEELSKYIEKMDN
jgi:hypothetical protein